MHRSRFGRLSFGMAVVASIAMVTPTSAFADETKTELEEAAAPTSETRLTSADATPSSETTGTTLLTPPETMWPVYVAGAVGLTGLATAAIFGGLSANSDHAVDVTTQALVRKGKPLSTCDQRPAEIPYGDVCAALQKNKRLASSHHDIFVPSLIVGISATALAVGWFLLAPKEQAERTGISGAHVVPWVSVGSGGATVEGRF